VKSEEKTVRSNPETVRSEERWGKEGALRPIKI